MYIIRSDLQSGLFAIDFIKIPGTGTKDYIGEKTDLPIQRGNFRPK
jgi:hypothetical protein